MKYLLIFIIFTVAIIMSIVIAISLATIIFFLANISPWTLIVTVPMVFAGLFTLIVWGHDGENIDKS